MQIRKPLRALVCGIVAAFACSTSAIYGQSIFATLTGSVADPSGSSIPSASVVLKNESSGDIRRSVTNNDGFFTFAAVPAGTYSVSIEAAGFNRVQETGIAFTGAEKRNVNFVLKVGSTATQMEVTSAADTLVPVDSGEKSATLTTKQLQDFSVVGRSAAEFIKILPGFSATGTGVKNSPGFSGEVTGINGNGEGGKQSAISNYSANGLGAQAIDITADGAHVSDPGCNCASPVNPNTDMIQEFKVQTSNFSAENSKGPVVMSSISKAGGQTFHGEGYLYARNYSLNTADWQDNQLGLKKPQNSYLFPGAQIGGPVLIPKTNFNHDKNKLFFFTAYEYYKQTLDTGLLQANVPTAAQRTGDFSNLPSSIQLTDIAGNPLANNKIPASLIDPNGKALINLFPLPNHDPANGGYNYVDKVDLGQNSYQWLSRVDYSISDNTKLFVRYNLQNELQQFPVGLWWRQGSNPVPYPTPLDAHNTSKSVSASLTHVFSPTLTSETVFGYTFINFPNSFENKAAVDRTKLGLNFAGVYKNGVAQFPSLLSYSGDIATVSNPGGFEAGNGTLFATKYLPSISSNLSKVLGTHTIKTGFYWERIRNTQPANNNTNGLIQYASYLPGAGTGNKYADLLQGWVQNYSESNLNPIHNEAFATTEFFVQDAWKATRRLTLEYGMRFQHLGNWTDEGGVGFAIFDRTKFTQATQAPTAYDGLQWNKINKSVPLSGFAQKALFYNPRFGLAYDLFGTGKTVIRGGWGSFRYHTAQFTTGYDIGYGVLNYGSSQYLTFNQLAAQTPTYTGRQSASALDGKNDQQPLTRSYSFTISQRLGDGSLMEASYVGNSSKYLSNDGTYNNINAVPYGTLLNNPDRNNLSTDQYDALRPLNNYQDLKLATNNLYGNYNGLQLTYAKQRGRYNIQANYTFSKALGIVSSADTLNLDNNYGALGYDRRHVFNAAYSIELGNPIGTSGRGYAKAVLNGWQISGITQLTSGVNLTAASNNQNFNLQTTGGLTNRDINGTDSVQIQPVLTCNPTSNLGKNQYINGSCFALPSPGHNGSPVLPEIFGPAFFDSDLSGFKNFVFNEKGTKKLQLRFSAYNFLNHPVNSFYNNGDNNLTLRLGADGKNTNQSFGTVDGKTGRRVIQLAAKFYF